MKLSWAIVHFCGAPKTELHKFVEAGVPPIYNLCHRQGKRLALTPRLANRTSQQPSLSNRFASAPPSFTPTTLPREPSPPPPITQPRPLPPVVGRIPNSAYRSGDPGLVPAGSCAQRRSSRHQPGAATHGNGDLAWMSLMHETTAGARSSSPKAENPCPNQPKSSQLCTKKKYAA